MEARGREARRTAKRALPSGRVSPSNEEIAQILDEVGELLSAQGANPFRAAAYKNGASVVRRLSAPLTETYVARGIDALVELPAIGASLALAIVEILDTGSLAVLERLRGQADPESLLATVPGIGAELARRIHAALGVETLEELEIAAHDGRLARVTGYGPRRIRGVIDALAGRLGRRERHSMVANPPPIAELLDVDREYRDAAARGALRHIAPRRFNPNHEAWLPILHTHRDERQYTALFSNTARAHELSKTNDWVVIFGDDGWGERQATVVTETQGPLAGRRVVRGREHECLGHYALALPVGHSGQPLGAHDDRTIAHARSAAALVTAIDSPRTPREPSS